MIANRSVPAETVLPHVVYESVEDAVAWLTKAFGFNEHYRYGAPGEAGGAQMYLGPAFIMVKRARAGSSTPVQLGASTQSLTIFLEDIAGHHQRAQAAGAKIVEEPHETEYGEFQYAALDFAGHHWLFSRHATDRDPASWGAAVASPPRPLAKARPSFCYIEIPALNADDSAAFYEQVFGWRIRHSETNRPSFDDASGHISGAWVTGRLPFSGDGLLPYIWVDDLEAILKKAAAHGATVLQAPHPDHPGGNCLIATFRDSAGNVIGLYQEPDA